MSASPEVSPDRAGQLHPDSKQPSRPHPPRLQHSPSMPNIWFPPHSGPIPPRLTENFCDGLRRPPTPPAFENFNSSPAIDSCSAKDTATLISDADTTPHKLSGKGTRRHRMNYEQQTVLLTPPLTPSSSIRTTGSVESGSNSYKAVVDPGNEAGLANTEGCFVDSDTVSTRFLLIRNVSRKVSSEGLQFAILRSLSAATPPHSTAIPPTSPNRTTGPPNHLPIVDTIKGVLLRYHESHGIAILAFYDVRQAKLAQALLSTPTIGTLSDCVGDGGNYNGQRWLDCAFVTPTDLAQMVGKSSFLAETQASFLFAVEVDHTTADSDKNARREINISALTDLLGTYGGLRSFTIMQETPQLPSRKVFHVEYYDVRDANTALAALEGQVLFGMHLSPLGRDSHSLESQTSPSKINSKSCIPFPSSHLEKSPTQALIRFDAAGHRSQIRERFLFIDTAGRARPRSASAGHEILEGPALGPSAPTVSSESPLYFYKSPPTSPSTGTLPTPRTPDSHSRRASNHLFFDAVGRPVHSVSEQSQDTPKRPRSVSFSSVTEAGRGHEQGGESTVVLHDHDSSPQFEYFYSPSDRFLPSSHPQPYYNGCPTPPVPPGFSYAYHPPRLPQLLTSGMGFPGCPPSPLGFAYEYDQQAHAHAVMNMGNMNMGNWAFEQAMMVPTPTVMGMFPNLPFSGPSMPGSDYWQGSPSPIPQHMAYYHYPALPPDSPLLQHPPLTKLQSPAHHSFSHALQLPSPSSPVHPPRTAPPTNEPPSSAGAREPLERNQLNLARIEDGQDTRTTVMIKNIPNKMSDKDLMAYIGAVCLRKIDFLYLRMDFQNGCNVGYAFVNFISVQDLLRFAKAKLGEKWNMFSSEKVLQMSYANYQGKEALVEKFKNSCIMDEREAWQPKIFYSNPGPEQGLPEPFPAPTHLRRKERSSYNRGPLYVPGMASQSVASSPNRRQQSDEHRLPPRPRRLRDQDEPHVYSLAEGMASASLTTKRPNKK